MKFTIQQLVIILQDFRSTISTMERKTGHFFNLQESIPMVQQMIFKIDPNYNLVSSRIVTTSDTTITTPISFSSSISSPPSSPSSISSISSPSSISPPIYSPPSSISTPPPSPIYSSISPPLHSNSSSFWNMLSECNAMADAMLNSSPMFSPIFSSSSSSISPINSPPLHSNSNSPKHYHLLAMCHIIADAINKR